MVLPVLLLCASGYGLRACPPISGFLSWEDLSSFSRDAKAQAILSPIVDPEMEWDELVLSWNAEGPRDETLKFEARTWTENKASRWFVLGVWTKDQSKGVRESLNGQAGPDGDVLTDTLTLENPARKFQIRITVTGPRPETSLKVNFLAAALHFTAAPGHNLAPEKSAWGKLIEVPKRAQNNYPNGNVLCSPTSVSMVLSHWAKVEGRPEWDRDVPEVAEGVYDRVWKGTGNWPFNTAFAGSLPGIRAYVARLWDVQDLERQIAQGFPVIVSVSYDLLKGKGKRGPNDGHLVVLVGFEEDGTPIFNDPGRGVVRVTYERAHFEEAWKSSGRTVYMIHPAHRTPAALLPNSPG